MTPSYEQLEDLCRAAGPFRTLRLELNLVGVRGWEEGRGVVPNLRNAYNDTIFAVYLDAYGARRAEAFRASVDPGAFAKFYDAHGDAHLLNGRYDFQRGLHQGRYPALVQAGPVRIWRDRDKDGAPGPGEEPVYEGYFGINIHAAGLSDRVGGWSAGCQVIWGGVTGKPWTRFMELVRACPVPSARIPYTLVDGVALLPAATV